MCNPVLDRKRFLQSKRKAINRIEQLEEITIFDGGTAVEVYYLERMKDRGMNLAVHAKGFSKSRGFHPPCDTASPRDVGSDAINDAGRNALRNAVGVLC